MAVELEALNSEISGFNEKYKGTKLATPEELNAYIKDADEILGKYPNPDGEVRKALGKFCSHLGCWVTVFGQDLEHGIAYYHKSIELDPESYDIRFEYYTTLEEIVDDDDYRTPEFVQDAVDCLKFCINYCNTPELREEHYIHYRYVDLGRVYLADKQYVKAHNCAKASLKILNNDNAQNLLKQADKHLGFFARLFAGSKGI